MPDAPPSETASTEASPADPRTLGFVDALPDPFIVLSPVRDDADRIVDFVYTVANEPACAFNGRALAELIGTRLLDLHPAAADTGLLDSYRSVVGEQTLGRADRAMYRAERSGHGRIEVDDGRDAAPA
jgi:GGDEF domain-containing protein